MAAKPVPAGYNVVAVMKALELARAVRRAACNFHVTYKGRLLGRLQVGRGSVTWFPRGMKNAKQIPWDIFATMIREWPFGSRVGAKLKFADGHLYWKAPGTRTRGRGKQITWPQFVRCMPKRAPKRASGRKTLSSP